MRVVAFSNTPTAPENEEWRQGWKGLVISCLPALTPIVTSWRADLLASNPAPHHPLPLEALHMICAAWGLLGWGSELGGKRETAVVESECRRLCRRRMTMMILRGRGQGGGAAEGPSGIP